MFDHIERTRFVVVRAAEEGRILVFVLQVICPLPLDLPRPHHEEQVQANMDVNQTTQNIPLPCSWKSYWSTTRLPDLWNRQGSSWIVGGKQIAQELPYVLSVCQPCQNQTTRNWSLTAGFSQHGDKNTFFWPTWKVLKKDDTLQSMQPINGSSYLFFDLADWQLWRQEGSQVFLMLVS